MPFYRELFTKLLKTLQQIQNQISRAKRSHRMIDESIEVFFATNPAAEYLVSCKSGCSNCCHSQVSINADEAILLGSLIESGEVSINHERLKKQSSVGNDHQKYSSLSFEERKCIFLNENSECSVYKNRPIVCRTNFVVSKPELCRQDKGEQIRLVKNDIADLTSVAAFRVSGDGGTLPSMISKYLSREQIFNLTPDEILKKVS